MSRYPCELSFRALTILIEHIENNGDWPIIRNDSSRNICTTSLIARGILRVRNSQTTTITRHGHQQFCKACGLWAEFQTRLELKRQEIDDTPPPHAAKKETATTAGIAPVASGCSNPVANQQGEAIPTERKAA